MTNAEPIGGIVGGAAALGSAASRAAKRTYGLVANTERWAIYLVLFAGVITIVKKNANPDPWSYAMWFGISLGVAALLYEMSASKGVVRAWWQGQPGSMVWSALIWAVAFGFSVNNWIGAASENQAEKTNLHRAAFNQSADVRSAVKELEAQLDIKSKSIDWSKTLDAADSYDAKIKAAEADATFEATRNGCKSKCIAKQQLAASLKADKQNAVNRAETQEEIKILKSKLDEARKVASNTKVETSEARNDLIVLTRYAGMTEESAQIFNGLFSIMVVSILLSFGSMRAELEELRKAGPRVTSNIGLNIKRWFCRLFLGREPKHIAQMAAKGPSEMTVKIDDRSGVNDLIAQIKAACAPAARAA